MVITIAPELNVSRKARNGKDPPHAPKQPPPEFYCVIGLEVLKVTQPHSIILEGRGLARRAGKKGYKRVPSSPQKVNVTEKMALGTGLNSLFSLYYAVGVRRGLKGKSHQLEKTAKLQFLGLSQSGVSKQVILIQMLQK